MHAAAYHIPQMVEQNDNIKQFSGQGKYNFILLGTLLLKSVHLALLFMNAILNAILFIVLGVEKNNDDARRIIQRKSNHCDDPAEVLRTEYRLAALHHRERQHRKYTKKNTEYWEEQIKTKRGKKRGISYLKPVEDTQTKENVSKKTKKSKQNKTKTQKRRKK